MMTGEDLERRVRELKSAFDDAFRTPHDQGRREERDFLLITVGAQPYALRVSELAGVQADRKIIPLPLARPGLVGLCAIRGELVAVFDLAAILGMSSQSAGARWMALHREGAHRDGAHRDGAHRDNELTGLVFAQMLGSRRIAARDLRVLGAAGEQARFSREAVQVDSRLVPVLDVPSVISSVRQGIHRG